MRLHGYCTECHKIKMVNVPGHALALAVVRGVAEGVCDDCERKR